MLGAFLPSSGYLTRNLMDHIDWPQARVIVEYGPGVGTLTQAMLGRLRRDGALVAIEKNPDFVEYLNGYFEDPRLNIHEGSADEVTHVLDRIVGDSADCIISGIPYTTMPAEVRSSILRRSYEALRPGGLFLVYQYTSAVLPHLKEVFGDVQTELEFRNWVPARIFRCRK